MIEQSFHVFIDESKPLSIEVEIVVCVGILEKTSLKDKDQGKDQGKDQYKDQEEYQSKTRYIQFEEGEGNEKHK